MRLMADRISYESNYFIFRSIGAMGSGRDDLLCEVDLGEEK